MRNLIPHFIQEQFRKEKEHGRMKAYTLFVDLSGFTRLTETMMKQGTRGAEELSNILNEIFEPLVELVYRKGGCIPYFAGDAFIAIFLEDQISAKELIYTAQQARQLFSAKNFLFGDFQFGIRAGLSFGEVEWGILGGRQKTFYFRGQAVNRCADCQTIASNLDIVIDISLKERLAPQSVKLELLPGPYFRVVGNIAESENNYSARKKPSISKAVALSFLPRPVVQFNHAGEFRPAVSIFISFEGVETHDELNNFVTVILDQINNFSGYFKEVDFGDKGGVLVAFFGAPVSFENNIYRALEFISTVREELHEILETTNLRFRTGITHGTAYAGIVGGKERCQYATVGNLVNLAARLMTYANWGEMLVDEEVQKNRHFNFKHKGDIQYKGVSGDVPTYLLVGRNIEKRPVYTGQMVGRKVEMERLLSFATPALEGKYAGMAYLFGEAGIGKSRLSHEFRTVLSAHYYVNWITCQADQILRKPFNPFIYFLKNYFEQSPENTPKYNQESFEKRIEWLINDLSISEHPEKEEVIRELTRTKSILAALVGINYEDSLWEQLDAKGRYQNTLLALANLLIAESLTTPLVIELEDGHWFDNNSIEFLKEFTRRLGKYPIFILITSRYRDDATKPYLIPHELLKENQVPELEIDLNILKPHTLRIFAEGRLKSEISEDLEELLIRTTNGNPFYAEQIIEYFIESNLLHKIDDLWHIKDNSVRLSSSINAILMARIDRLSSLVKETVKAAAVIGREFEVSVLSEVMKTQEAFAQENGNTLVFLKEQIKTAERGQIWRAMNELRYIFKHSLLREAVYDMQLRGRLRELHRLIAEAIEKLYASNIEERYVDLAFHYEQAEVVGKTMEYLSKAGDFARRNYQNYQALDFYNKLLVHLEQEGGDLELIKIYLKKGSILQLIGQWEKCEETYLQALNLTQRTENKKLLGRTNNVLGYLLMLKGNYEEAEKYLEIAATFFGDIDDKRGISKTYGDLGNLYFRQGEYEEAKSFFEQSIAMNQQFNYVSANAQIVSNLGLTHMNQGNFDEGIRCLKEQLSITESANDRPGLAATYTNLGIVYFEKGSYDSALDCYEKGLQLSEELGNKQLTSIAIGCIGSVYERKGDYPKAMDLFLKDLKLCEELGDKQGTAIASALIGELNNIKGEFEQADVYLKKSLLLCEKLGYQKGVAKSLNALGDVSYYTGKFDQSLQYYDRAIEVTRKIKNKLVLGFSLVEKGNTLLQLGGHEALRAIHVEASELARELGNPDLIFESNIFAARVKYFEEGVESAKALLEYLLQRPVRKYERATILYEMGRFTKEKNYWREALKIYKELYKETPKFSFKRKMENLKLWITKPPFKA
ncbi:MAG: tetratricopeptide repeat protein [Bacteroidetes bacterium]|nr:tetratricopeptide repeat protein [Bacteroidota bacterium]